jgi:hypothetical protein
MSTPECSPVSLFSGVSLSNQGFVLRAAVVAILVIAVTVMYHANKCWVKHDISERKWSLHRCIGVSMVALVIFYALLLLAWVHLSARVALDARASMIVNVGFVAAALLLLAHAHSYLVRHDVRWSSWLMTGAAVVLLGLGAYAWTRGATLSSVLLVLLGVVAGVHAWEEHSSRCKSRCGRGCEPRCKPDCDQKHDSYGGGYEDDCDEKSRRGYDDRRSQRGYDDRRSQRGYDAQSAYGGKSESREYELPSRY